MPPKPRYDPRSRHSSFRPSQDEGHEGIPGMKWFILMLVLAAGVIGHDRLHKRAPEIQPPPQAEIQQQSQAEIPQEEGKTAMLAEEAVPSPPMAAPPQPSDAAPPETIAPPEPPPQAVQPPAGTPGPAPDTETTVKYEMEKGAGGFVGLGAINDQEVAMLADTGASHLVIPETIAQKLGLKKGRPIAFATGGGTVAHYATTLDKLTLGRIEMRNVPAVINPAMREDFILLGMSVMGLFDMRIDASKLVLQHKQAKTSSGFAAEEPFKRPLKECASHGNKFDQQALECLRGGGG